MKDRPLAFLALIIAAGALAHSLWLHQRADALADAALRRREAELVGKATQGVSEICQNMMEGGKFQPETFHPKTIEELFLPLKEVITQFAEVSEGVLPTDLK